MPEFDAKDAAHRLSASQTSHQPNQLNYGPHKGEKSHANQEPGRGTKEGIHQVTHHNTAKDCAWELKPDSHVFGYLNQPGILALCLILRQAPF
jgi:hypothetical protein